MLRRHWPDLTISETGDATIMADARALESVLTNLIQNSVTHGKATQVNINVKQGNGRVTVRLVDNGSGFHGDAIDLGKLFVRHTRGSGSGVGLYIVRQLLKRMKGMISFKNADDGGFEVLIELPAAENTSERIRERAGYEASVAGRR